MTHKFKLGTRLKCKISGLEGIATGRIEYLNGCVQYGLRRPLDKDGKVPDMDWVDEAYLSQTDEGIHAEIESKPIGGELPPKGCNHG